MMKLLKIKPTNLRKGALKLAGTAALMLAVCANANAWQAWDDFTLANFQNGRIVEALDLSAPTTSEGQGYALFFALVAGDRNKFKDILDWTTRNLGSSDSPTPAASSFGRHPYGGDAVLDSANSIGADMWIVYSLLEAGRLWGNGTYTRLGKEGLARLKRSAQYIPGIGRVLMTENDRQVPDARASVRPANYPPFILKRFAQEDPFFNDVYQGAVRAITTLSPDGFVPDRGFIEADGSYKPGLQAVGSRDGLKTYLWCAMLSKDDPNYSLLRRHLENAIWLADRMNVPPSKIDLTELSMTIPGKGVYGVSFYPYKKNEKGTDLVRRIVKKQDFTTSPQFESFLKLFGDGFDSGEFLFDDKGYLLLNGPYINSRERSRGE